jgi:hypothetical protein
MSLLLQLFVPSKVAIPLNLCWGLKINVYSVTSLELCKRGVFGVWLLLGDELSLL